MRRNEKKGMSLIVLVITIIIMIILASAIILSLNDTNIIGRAEEARTLSDNTNKRQAANIALGEYLLEKEPNPNIEQTAEQFVMEKLAAQGIDTTNIAVAGNKVIVGSGASAIKQGVNIREYVEYIPDVKTSTIYKMFNEYEGKSTEPFKTEADIKWKYMGIDDSGNILLAADRATTGVLYLEGKEGYLQGPIKLNKLCKELYSSNKGEARSINVEDVNKLLGVKPIIQFNNSSNKKQDLTYQKTIGQIKADYNQPELVYTDTPDGKDINNYLINYYFYLGSTTPKGKTLEGDLTPEYNLVFKEGSGTTNMYYWLASSCVYADFYYDYVGFNMRYVGSDFVGASDIFGTDGVPYNFYCEVRPVVTIKYNVQIEDKVGDTWKLK